MSKQTNFSLKLYFSIVSLVQLLFVIRADRILTLQQREHKQATELSSRLERLLDKSVNFDARPGQGDWESRRLLKVWKPVISSTS